MALPVTTIPPFTDSNKLPACAVNCGALYDANGACVPPAVAVGEASAYTACFCSHGAVAPFSTAAAGVCDSVCQPDGASSIQGWFQGICGIKNTDNNNNNGGNNGGSDSGSGGDSGSGSDSGNSNGNTGSNTGTHKGIKEPTGDWLSNHWQWVIMLVILVVGIAGIWVGACIWRRRYLKKKDRQSTVPQKQSGSVSHPSWGPDMNPSGAPAAGAPGVFMPGSTTASPTPYEEKSKKKWTVSERT